jgi:hypothetical protein
MGFDIDALDEGDPFEINDQAAHLFKHAPLGVSDIYEVWDAEPLLSRQAASTLADGRRGRRRGTRRPGRPIRLG